MLPKSEQNENLQFYQGSSRYQADHSSMHGSISGQIRPMATNARAAFSPGGTEFDEFTEPPLLEELGIDFNDIWSKTKYVLIPMKIDSKSMEEGDLAGPLVYCILLGAFLLLSGKLYFGYIYGFGIVGCVGIYTVLNLMSKNDLDFHRIMSILGYCLLPIVLLALVSVVFDLSGRLGLGIAFASISWCTWSAVRFIESVFKMQEQRWLIAYPAFLLYTCFAMITVFGKV